MLSRAVALVVRDCGIGLLSNRLVNLVLMLSTRNFSTAVPVRYYGTSRYPSRVKTVPGMEGGRYFQKLGGVTEFWLSRGFSPSPLFSSFFWSHTSTKMRSSVSNRGLMVASPDDPKTMHTHAICELQIGPRRVDHRPAGRGEAVGL